MQELHPDMDLRGIRVKSTQQAQGQQAGFILFDTTIGENIGFVDFRLLNVGSSRAQNGQIVMMNMTVREQHTSKTDPKKKIFQDIIDYAKKAKLTFTPTEVMRSNDFLSEANLQLTRDQIMITEAEEGEIDENGFSVDQAQTNGPAGAGGGMDWATDNTAQTNGSAVMGGGIDWSADDTASTPVNDHHDEVEMQEAQQDGAQNGEQSGKLQSPNVPNTPLTLCSCRMEGRGICGWRRGVDVQSVITMMPNSNMATAGTVLNFFLHQPESRQHQRSRDRDSFR